MWPYANFKLCTEKILHDTACWANFLAGQVLLKFEGGIKFCLTFCQRKSCGRKVVKILLYTHFIRIWAHLEFPDSFYFSQVHMTGARDQRVSDASQEHRGDWNTFLLNDHNSTVPSSSSPGISIVLIKVHVFLNMSVNSYSITLVSCTPKHYSCSGACRRKKSHYSCILTWTRTSKYINYNTWDLCVHLSLRGSRLIWMYLILVKTGHLYTVSHPQKYVTNQLICDNQWPCHAAQIPPYRGFCHVICTWWAEYLKPRFQIIEIVYTHHLQLLLIATRALLETAGRSTVFGGVGKYE